MPSDANDEHTGVRLPSIVDGRPPFVRTRSESSEHAADEDNGSNICTPINEDCASGQETAASSSAITSLASFDAEEWLDVGKLWSDEIPAHVRHARDQARTIPQSLRSTFIPKTTITVDALLCFQPPLRPPTTSASAGARFSQDIPSVLVQIRTHFIMSLGSFSGEITVQALQLVDGSPMEFITLGVRVSQLLRTLTDRKGDICRAVKTLCQLLNPRRKRVAPASAANPTEMSQKVVDGSEENSDSDESVS